MEVLMWDLMYELIAREVDRELARREREKLRLLEEAGSLTGAGAKPLRQRFAKLAAPFRRPARLATPHAQPPLSESAP
jgi:hypothetical protein